MTSNHTARFLDEENNRVVIEGASLIGEDLSAKRCPEWVVMESRFERCSFNGVKANFSFGVGRRMSDYIDCSFDEARLSAGAGRNGGRARFVRCSFRNTRIEKINFNYAEFVDCVFTGEVNEVNFSAELDPRYRAELGRSSNRYERNDFSGARLKGVALKDGVDLLDQRLPSEDGYLLVEDAEAVLPAAAAEALTWPESPVRAEIISELEFQLKWYVRHGQRQLLFSPYDYVSRDGAKERLFTELTKLLIGLGARNLGESA